jgi:hypothetical protein
MTEVRQSLHNLHRILSAARHLSRTMLVAVLPILALAALGGFWWLFFWGIGHLFGAW